MRKFINFILCAALMFTMLPADGFAASPVVFEGSEITVFEQSFGGLNGSDDLADFTVEGTKWQYTDYFMGIPGSAGISSVATKSNIDLSESGGFELQTKMTMTYQYAAIYLGYNPDTQEGYMLKNGGGQLALYKDTDWSGTPVATSATTGAYYGVDVEYTVTVQNGVLNVSTSAGDTLTCSCDISDFNGKFGVITLSTADFAVFYMNLYKHEASTVVNTWKYEKNFSAADTVEALAKDGITLSNSDVTFEDGDMHTSGNQVVTYGPYNKDLSGDYTFEAKVHREWNHTVVRFNYVDDSNYYQFMLYAHNNYKDDPDNENYHTVRLTKVKGGVSQMLGETKYNTSDTGAGGSELAYKISVEETADGLKIDASVQNQNYTGEEVVIPTVTDSTDYISSGKIQIRNESTGGSKLYYLKAYSTPSEETYTKDVVITNKTVTANDTVETLAAEGITFSQVPKAFYNEETNEECVVLPNYTAPIVAYAPKSGNLGESYTFEGKIFRGYNDDYLQFNYIDDNNYYKVQVTSQKKEDGVFVDGNYAELIKVQNGKSETLLKLTEIDGANEDWAGTCGTYTLHDYKVVVNKTDAGLQIDVEVRNGYTEDVIKLSALDSEPLDKGIARMCFPSTDQNRFYYIKHTESRTMGGTYTKDVNVLNKTFAASDTTATLAADNITLSVSPTEFCDGYLSYEGGVHPTVVYAPDGGLSESYTFETSVDRGWKNNPTIKFNVQDASNYYSLVFYNDNDATAETYMQIRLNKVVGGKEENLGITTYDNNNFANGYISHAYKITVENGSAGTNIKADITASNGSGTFTVEGTDSASDFSGGSVEMSVFSGDYSKIHYINYTKHVLCGDTGEYQGHFYIDNYAVSSMDAGEISFEFPVAYMGNHTVAAALYEDNRMTEVKTFEAMDMYSGIVDLFDTTSSDADDISVKVFFFDSETSLNRLTEVYELK